MAKITDPDLLVLNTSLTLDTTAKTFTLVEAGSLIAKDGITIQCIYSKFVELWTTSAYNKFPFPAYAIDAKSGQFQFGTDGQTYNGWKPANDVTRQMMRDGGWSEYSTLGVLNRQYVGMIALASGFPAGAQFYYQKNATGPATNFTFTDAPNQGIQVFGDAANGAFDDRTYFKLFSREYGYTYDNAVLGDVGASSTGAFTVALPIAVGSDLKITANDVSMTNAPYNNINITYYAADQSRTIGASSYNFRIIIAGNNATAEQIYTKIEYLLRQNSDIDTGVGTVTGQTANSLLYFIGDTMYTTQGVYIDNYNTNDINRLVFNDQTGVNRIFPYTASGNLNFNSFLQSGNTGYYRMYFTVLPGANNDYGEAGAVTVNDKDGTPITGTISSASISFSFAYDANVQGGRTAATDAGITVVAGNKGFAKPVVTQYTITRTTGQSISLVAEQDRAYLNP